VCVFVCVFYYQLYVISHVRRVVCVFPEYSSCLLGDFPCLSVPVQLSSSLPIHDHLRRHSMFLDSS